MAKQYRFFATITEANVTRVLREVVGDFDDAIRAYDGYMVIMRQMKNFRENMASLAHGYALEAFRGDGARVFATLKAVEE